MHRFPIPRFITAVLLYWVVIYLGLYLFNCYNLFLLLIGTCFILAPKLLEYVGLLYADYAKIDTELLQTLCSRIRSECGIHERLVVKVVRGCIPPFLRKVEVLRIPGVISLIVLSQDLLDNVEECLRQVLLRYREVKRQQKRIPMLLLMLACCDIIVRII